MTKDEIKLLQAYGKAHHAGAFAVPLPKELDEAEAEGRIHRWPGVLGVETRAKRELRRRDFTGDHYALAPGSRILEHLGIAAGAQLPSLRTFDYVYAYAEDRQLAEHLEREGFTRAAVAIAASSAISVVYDRNGWFGSHRAYPSCDAATMTEIPLAVDEHLRADVLAEVQQMQGWSDQDPYYHKGEWGQVSLRGYAPENPFWGVKPPEMSRAWKEENPDLAQLTRCDWTVLSAKTPSLLRLIDSVGWWHSFERIRLLRLTTGRLTRHTDITDREAGTRDGQIARFHIPIITHPDVRAVAWDLDGRELAQHWGEWRLYYLDQRKPHAAINPTEFPRVHLVVDVYADAAVRQQIAASYQGAR